jgi:hypothetical protein
LKLIIISKKFFTKKIIERELKEKPDYYKELANSYDPDNKLKEEN